MAAKFPAKAGVLGVLGAGLLLGGSVAGIGSTPTAHADGCGSGAAPFTNWGVCDYGWAPDGSHMHCDTVFVFGFGGSNCFWVPPPPPP